MAYTINSHLVGHQPLTATSTTQAHALGTVVKAVDSTYGEGEFVYLKGVASTAAGNVVVFDQKGATTTRSVAGSRGSVGVAMSANVASQFGWYQISGSAVVTCGTVSAAKGLYVTATPGSVDDAIVLGDLIVGAVSITANGTPATGQLVAQLSRPSIGGAWEAVS